MLNVIGISRSLGTPTVRGESLAMELALHDANLNPVDVSYVEAHGTGTPVGKQIHLCGNFIYSRFKQ